LFDAPLSIPEDLEKFYRQPWLVGIDGDRFLFHVPVGAVRDPTIEVILNWEELL